MSESLTPRKLENNVLRASLFNIDYRFANQYILNDIISFHISHNNIKPLYLANHNLHSLALIRQNPKMQDYYSKADYVWLDGMPVVWMLKTLGYKINKSWRTTFLDWDKKILSIANKNKWKIFLLGASEKNICLAANNLTQLYPNIVFAYNHGFISDVNDQVVQIINKFQPDILLVGMGMPLQERWILQNKNELQVKVTMPIGGYFDYLAGTTYTPPRWLGPIGLEWLARLLTSPRRLGYRYLIEPWPVLYLFVNEYLRRLIK